MSREQLEASDIFAAISPKVGELDELAFEAALAEDPDTALSLLPELAQATDVSLREQAKRLAGRVILDRAKRGPATRAGIGRPRGVSADRPGADLDVDASLEAVVEARAGGRDPALKDLWAREWGRATVAVCLLVDRSGSMAGARLAAAGLAAAACAWRAPDDNAVLVFSDQVLAVRAMGEQRPAASVVEDLLQLRGRGTTDLAAALDAAAVQLRRSNASRRVCVLLSDCEVNTGTNPIDAAAAIDELVVVGPEAGGEVTTAFCAASGARGQLAAGPTATVMALAELLA